MVQPTINTIATKFMIETYGPCPPQDDPLRDYWNTRRGMVVMALEFALVEWNKPVERKTDSQ